MQHRLPLIAALLWAVLYCALAYDAVALLAPALVSA